jgi:hypothetical protein
MPNKSKPIPHIPLKFEDAVAEFLKVKPPKKRKRKKATTKDSRR